VIICGLRFAGALGVPDGGELARTGDDVDPNSRWAPAAVGAAALHKAGVCHRLRSKAPLHGEASRGGLMSNWTVRLRRYARQGLWRSGGSESSRCALPACEIVRFAVPALTEFFPTMDPAARRRVWRRNRREALRHAFAGSAKCTEIALRFDSAIYAASSSHARLAHLHRLSAKDRKKDNADASSLRLCAEGLHVERPAAGPIVGPVRRRAASASRFRMLPAWGCAVATLLRRQVVVVARNAGEVRGGRIGAPGRRAGGGSPSIS
jgi:hypothetical protein